MTHTNLLVPDISCEHCERTIVGAVGSLKGVSSVSVDVPAHRVAIEFDEASIGLDQIIEVLEREEYPVAGAGPGA